MYNRILVPLDGSRTAAAGLREAIRLASGNNRATIRLLHVMDPLPAMQGMEVIITEQLIENMEQFGRKVLKDAKSLVRRHGIGVDTVFQEQALGRTSDAIVKQARKWRANLIVMGTHGRRGVSRIVLGSDAEAVVRSAPAPVLLVRSGTRSR
jgi:nucleotide-binding universal stress UspA family protein